MKGTLANWCECQGTRPVIRVNEEKGNSGWRSSGYQLKRTNHDRSSIWQTMFGHAIWKAFSTSLDGISTIDAFDASTMCKAYASCFPQTMMIEIFRTLAHQSLWRSFRHLSITGVVGRWREVPDGSKIISTSEVKDDLQDRKSVV